MKLVLITWHDAHADSSSWTHIDDLEDDGPYVVRSAGFLLEKLKGAKRGHTSIAQSIGEDGALDSILHVPNKMVVKVETLCEVTDDVQSPPNAKRSPQSSRIPQKDCHSSLQ